MIATTPALPLKASVPIATSHYIVNGDLPLTNRQLEGELSRALAGFLTKMSDAFPARDSRLESKPSVVLFTNQDEFLAAGGVIGASAFVRADKPGKVFICLTEARKNAKDLRVSDLQFLKATVSHELGHLYSMKFAQKLQTDRSTPLAETIIFEDSRRAGFSSMSAKEFLLEFSGDYIAKTFLGKDIFLDRYKAVHALGNRLIEKVGKDVFLKAIIGNDPTAYQGLLLATADLAKNQKLDFGKAEVSFAQKEFDNAIKSARSTNLVGKHLEAVILERYFAEVRFLNALEAFAPDRKSQYDFSFSNAVGKALIEGGLEIDSTSSKCNEIIFREWAKRPLK